MGVRHFLKNLKHEDEKNYWNLKKNKTCLYVANILDAGGDVKKVIFWCGITEILLCS